MTSIEMKMRLWRIHVRGWLVAFASDLIAGVVHRIVRDVRIEDAPDGGRVTFIGTDFIIGEDLEADHRVVVGGRVYSGIAVREGQR